MGISASQGIATLKFSLWDDLLFTFRERTIFQALPPLSHRGRLLKFGVIYRKTSGGGYKSSTLDSKQTNEVYNKKENTSNLSVSLWGTIKRMSHNGASRWRKNTVNKLFPCIHFHFLIVAVDSQSGKTEGFVTTSTLEIACQSHLKSLKDCLENNFCLHIFQSVAGPAASYQNSMFIFIRPKEKKNQNHFQEVQNGCVSVLASFIMKMRHKLIFSSLSTLF